MVRAFNSEPGAWTMLGDRRLKIGRVRVTDEAGLAPGELEAGATVSVGTGDLSVELREVQPAGKRWMSGAEFARGLRSSDRLLLQ